MEVTFDKSFSKSLDKINDKIILKRIEKVILQCELASELNQISNLKKMVGFQNFYRIKIGDYRIGIEVINQTIDFLVVTHRKDIYKKFP
jgi:mRNA interferase RelE/StbE